MTNDKENFETLVNKSWSMAVSIASAHIEEYRPQIIKALQSTNPEVRSAAVTSLLEANSAAEHDDVIALVDDPDEVVREEVSEYLAEFAKPCDIKILLHHIEHEPNTRMHMSMALQKITGRERGTMYDDDPVEHVSTELSKWRQYLVANGYEI